MGSSIKTKKNPPNRQSVSHPTSFSFRRELTDGKLFPSRDVTLWNAWIQTFVKGQLRLVKNISSYPFFFPVFVEFWIIPFYPPTFTPLFP